MRKIMTAGQKFPAWLAVQNAVLLEQLIRPHPTNQGLAKIPKIARNTITESNCERKNICANLNPQLR